MSSDSIDLSIVIPAYNEERRLPETLDGILHYLAQKPCRAEVLIVDDGSSDRTAEVARRYSTAHPNVRLLSNDSNRGKGYSVRRGMLEAAGKLALFTDADLSTPIEEADKLIHSLCEERYDVAIGSRALNRSLIEVHQSALREQAGIFFNTLVRALTGLEFLDTQCGFKAFRTDRTRPIFEQQRIEGFGFDPEVLFLARRNSLRVKEIPVRWAHHPATKVHVVADGLHMFWDLLVIRWNALRGCYPHSVLGGQQAGENRAC